MNIDLLLSLGDSEEEVKQDFQFNKLSTFITKIYLNAVYHN